MAQHSKNANDPSLDTHAHELYEALNQLVRIYQFRDRDRICCYDVSVTQCSALEVIIEKGPLRLQALAEQLFLDKSTASRVIDTLVRKDYVTRLKDPEDSRAILIEATTAGRKLFTRIHTELVEEQKEMIADFAPDVRVAATELLHRLAGAASQRMGVNTSCSTEKSSGPGCC
ncbi:MAG TPA: MarR family transcriptional regulator [Oligoflexus sp.]|uniref:MarR family winged helix-turn-helix transcriptional regulator n=1 Tax=Oligoflexus sp. TaxID=1971216 RepID=UPI002D4138C7|nr:MarR family transcriptional regulator [Oligoflexus sp.]HYX38389.1 MarR family transcriptional regulator [Oligoflexus sp.]